MSNTYYQPFVITIKDRCRVCYTCVRECPAKAIKIADGQAEVIPDRCIGCGNCVRVCSQRAKQAVSSVEPVLELLAQHSDVTAIIAPSFAAEFADMDYEWFVGMVKALGFKYVNDVAFGADLVAERVNELVKLSKQERYISTACPAVFGYVKRYHPDLIESLMPIVSPMIASARALRKIRGEAIKIVFIGPCIAKKAEACSEEVAGEVDEVLTFDELRQMFQQANLEPDHITPCDFDPPYGYKGALFPLNRGLLQSAGIDEDLIDGGILSASGRTNFINAIMEFSSGEANAKFLDVLCCDGCIMGPGMTTSAGPLRKRALVSRYVRRMMEMRDKETWSYYATQFADLDLSRKFLSYDRRMEKPGEAAIREIMERLGKFEQKDELNCGACGYETCRAHAIAIFQGLAEQEMCLPYAIEQLHHTVGELAVSNTELASTREALIQSEKMASMGQLSAGIAHE
ncbi:4Fe-4S dicluster domain-containing protein, partial [bacterium]|nr:4Fe-4S dicluster domain-containing protein [bacterium]